MNPPHHDDYLNAQMHEYHSEGPAPAHHLPFDRLLPVPASFASAGELGEYMPQEDLASVADVPSGDAPGSDPAADGDDEDVHVAHPDDVEVQLAVSDERHMYVPHGDDREVFLGDVHVIDVRGGVDSAVVVGDEDVDETVITAEHEIPIEAQAGAEQVEGGGQSQRRRMRRRSERRCSCRRRRKRGRRKRNGAKRKCARRRLTR